MKHECFENDTYNLYTIETPKFKSCHMEVVFRSEATLENITYLAFLINMLFENSKNYPSKKTLARKLYDLYNVSLFGTSTRVGDTVLTNAVVDFLDPKYTDMETLEESIELLFEMILNPNADEFEFDEVTFDRIKKEMAIEIEALKEDPKQASILGAFREIDSHDPRSFNASGDADILKSITPKKLYDFYCKFLETSSRDIYLIGNLNMKNMNKIIRKYAKFKSITTVDGEVFIPEIKFKKTRSITVEGNSTQTQLVQIYSLVNLTDREREFVMPLFNMLWGSGSLESKLYKSLRGENSLCYNVSTFYQKYDKAIILHTAIDDSSTTLALKLINKALASIRKGFIEDEELTSVKNLLIGSLHMSLDSPARLIDNYVFKNLVGLEDIEKRSDSIRSVSIEEVIAVARKVQLALTYRVRGE